MININEVKLSIFFVIDEVLIQCLTTKTHKYKYTYIIQF